MTASTKAASSCSLLALALLLCGAGQASETFSPDDVIGPISWGSAKSVNQLGRLYIADQPDRAGFEAAQQAGVDIVIDLRTAAEHDWDERSAVEALGLVYYNVPVGGARFELPAFDRIEDLVAQNEGKQILIHCASGNRVGGWLATHLVRKHAMSEQDALAVARRAGITKDAVADGVHAFLAEQAK